MMRKVSLWWFIFFIAVCAGGVISLFASSSPDGLESVAIRQGFIGRATHFFEGVLPDYAVPGLSNTLLAQIIAGLIGTAIVFVLLYGIAWIINRVQQKARTEN